jgi:hypothetical protein
MSTFPPYHGELPRFLNPRRLRHYFLLTYWLYFRPTALKAYIYQLDPNLYRLGPEVSNFRLTSRLPAYRNLYVMIILLLLLIPGLLVLSVVPVSGWVAGTPIDWTTVVGFLAGILVTVGAGIVLSVTTAIVTGNVEFGVVIGVVVTLAVGAALGLARIAVLGLAFGLTIGMAFSLAVGVAGGVVFGLAFGLAGWAAGDTVFGLALVLGALRAPFYPVQLVLAGLTAFRNIQHPLEWDELGVLPLPGAKWIMHRRFAQDDQAGLRFIAVLARNPFQRSLAQRILQSYLHDHAEPLRFLYSLLASPNLNVYVFPPVNKTDWGNLPTLSYLLLGELAGQRVDCSNDPINRLAERLVWSLSWFWRDRRQTPLSRLARLLYRLLDDHAVESVEFDLARYQQVYANLGDYPGHVEIEQTFEAMSTLLSYDALLELPAARDVVANMVLGNALIRPGTVAALSYLGDVGAEVAAYRDATSRVNRLAALARAIDALDGLEEYLWSDVMAPERTILRSIARNWRHLISETSGKVGRTVDEGPVANPYVVGNPVSGHLFVGREDILRRLEELWGREEQPAPSVVLYGHRRMGKSSILQNLGARFGARTIVIDFNMQRVGLVRSSGELLLNLALAIYDSSPASLLESLGEPAEPGFLEGNPYTALDRFLKRFDRARGERRLLVTVDEFELLEEMIETGRLDPELFHYWRAVIQTYPWLVMAFAGLHTLQEMTRDYWHPLFGSVTSIPVSFLSHEMARRLIVNPAPDFPLDYDAEAVTRIVALAHGQPYLTQLIGHGLVTRYNRQIFDAGIARERRLTVADVEAIIESPEFYRDGDAYFSGVWSQATNGVSSTHEQLLRALALSGAGLTPTQMAVELDMAPAEVEQTLSDLARHDVIYEVEGCWQYTVELLRRWVARRS